MSNSKSSLQRPAQGFLPAEGFVGVKQILTVLPISRSTWNSGVHQGRYPKPIKHGQRSLWRVETIRELLESIASQASA